MPEVRLLAAVVVAVAEDSFGSCSQWPRKKRQLKRPKGPAPKRTAPRDTVNIIWNIHYTNSPNYNDYMRTIKIID